MVRCLPRWPDGQVFASVAKWSGVCLGGLMVRCLPRWPNGKVFLSAA